MLVNCVFFCACTLFVDASCLDRNANKSFIGVSTVEQIFCGDILDDASSNNLPSLKFLVSSNTWTGLVHIGILANGIACPFILFFLVEHCFLQLNVPPSCPFALAFLAVDVPFLSVLFFVALLHGHWWTLLRFLLLPPTSLLLWWFVWHSIPPHYFLAWRHRLIRKMSSFSASCTWFSQVRGVAVTRQYHITCMLSDNRFFLWRCIIQ